ncbi:MFS transporter [Velocimicrobium porci]|uniref:MFS transporter n=1 Tax=Velocimicrobium porci TaxID=2606634 RepID=A0A6L5Y083_9FIRM|nr:MFS transporter [Velocimicrobium porci]MSS64536.1 MFS transporter [Velocimicrobium porci]
MKRAFFPEKIKKESRLYIILLSLFELGDKIFGAIYIAFMRLKGASLPCISMLFSIQQILMAVLDLPTGAISDKIGRKKTASIGFLIWGISLQLFCIGTDFWTFLPGIVLFALGMAFISGALGTWLIDQIIKNGVYEKRGEIFPKAQMVIRFFSIAAAIVSIFLVNISKEFTIFVAGVFGILAGIIGFVVGEDNYGNVRNKKIHRILFESMNGFIKSKCLMIIALKTVVGYISFIAFILYWQIYTTEYMQISASYLSILLVSFMAALMMGNYAASILSKKTTVFNVVVIGYVVCLLGYIGLYINKENIILLFIVGAFLIEFGFGIEQVASVVWMNDYFDSDTRSTYSSLFSTIECTFGFLIINVLGLVADLYGINMVWALAAGSIIVTVGVMLWLNSCYKTEKEKM